MAPYLSLGWAQPASALGVKWNYQVSVPGAGFVDMKQLVACYISTAPAPATPLCTSADGSSPYTTDQDTCVVYDIQSTSSKAGNVSWPPEGTGGDAPGVPLQTFQTNVTSSWYFDDYLVYKPSGKGYAKARQAIWVYVAHVGWNWAGTGSRPNTSAPWQGPSNVTPGNTGGAVAYNSPIPTWTTTFSPLGEFCPGYSTP
jgi:hypothetical protein